MALIWFAKKKIPTMASWNLFVIIIFIVIGYIVSCANDVLGFRMIFSILHNSSDLLSKDESL